MRQADPASDLAEVTALLAADVRFLVSQGDRRNQRAIARDVLLLAQLPDLKATIHILRRRRGARRRADGGRAAEGGRFT
jgi:hypothetical protein